MSRGTAYARFSAREHLFASVLNCAVGKQHRCPLYLPSLLSDPVYPFLSEPSFPFPSAERVIRNLSPLLFGIIFLSSLLLGGRGGREGDGFLMYFEFHMRCWVAPYLGFHWGFGERSLSLWDGARRGDGEVEEEVRFGEMGGGVGGLIERWRTGGVLPLATGGMSTHRGASWR